MSAELTLELDRRSLGRFRTLMKANRTMAAKSLTFTAEKAQANWRAEMPGEFHLRRKWLPMGVRIKHANASNLVARVGSIDAFFGRHVKGVDDPKKAGRSALFVPAQPVTEQGTHTQIRSAMRRMWRTKTKPFKRNGMWFRRVGRKGNAGLRLLGVMRQSVEIEPRFDALGITARAVNQHFPTIYERLLIKWAASGK
jgi:hypothetical protein